MNLLLAMAQVLLTWGIAVAAFYGIGALVEAALRPRENPFPLPFARGWLGLCSVLILLQLLHFITPIAFWIAPAFLLPAFAGLALLAHRKQLPSPLPSRQFSLFTLLSSLFILWLANRATGQWLPYDTGFYHASTLEWFVQYPVVPGLANLFGPLALNSTSLLLAAALDSAFFVRQSHHVFCGIWIIMYLAWFAASWNAARKSRQWAPVTFDAAILPLFLAWGLGTEINGLTTDPAAIILSFVCVSICLRLLLEPREPAPTRSLFLLATLIGAAAITCKLITIIVVPLTLAITLVLLHRRKQLPPLGKLLAVLAIPLILTLAPWLTRNVIMSGYLIDPVPATAVNVPWRQPTELAMDQQAWIRSWSRIQNAPLEKTTGTQWIAPWTADILRTHWADLLAPLALALFAGFLLAFTRNQPIENRKLKIENLPLLLAPAAALAFWFWNAPDVRYGSFLAVMLSALAAALLLHMRPSVATRRAISISLALFALLLAAQRTTEFLRFLPTAPLHALYVYLPEDEPPLLPMPTPPCVEITTNSGLKIYAPTHDNRTYAATLPAAPKEYIHPNLRLRHPPNLRGGFYIDPANPSTKP